MTALPALAAALGCALAVRGWWRRRGAARARAVDPVTFPVVLAACVARWGPPATECYEGHPLARWDLPGACVYLQQLVALRLTAMETPVGGGSASARWTLAGGRDVTPLPAALDAADRWAGERGR